ncbi:MAG TPA: hypothetical protein VJ183_19580 [Chloroflexia bacterium]|nr:hypothetical protein [Chloroflexia bacterium]
MSIQPNSTSASTSAPSTSADGTNSQSDKPDDRLGKRIFAFLLILIPLIVAVALIVLTTTIAQEPDRSITSTIATQSSDGRTITTTTTYLTPTLGLGAFDPAIGKIRGFVIGPLIVLIGGILEASLLLVYGTFYVTYGRSDERTPLGLPSGAVRAFVLIIIILAIIAFAFLPEAWGDNRAVTFLLGLFSTIVGFYFGSRKDEDARKAGEDKAKVDAALAAAQSGNNPPGTTGGGASSGATGGGVTGGATGGSTGGGTPGTGTTGGGATGGATGGGVSGTGTSGTGATGGGTP